MLFDRPDLTPYGGEVHIPHCSRLVQRETHDHHQDDAGIDLKNRAARTGRAICRIAADVAGFPANRWCVRYGRPGGRDSLRNWPPARAAARHTSACREEFLLDCTRLVPPMDE